LHLELTHILRLTILTEAQYLPPVAFFAVLQGADTLCVERHEHYQKQSYRNRCTINTTQGPQDLVIPVTGKHGKVRITEVRLDDSQRWRANHWRAIRSAYGNAPFFEYFADDLDKNLQKPYTWLYDLNVDMLSMCLKWLKWNVRIQETLTYEKEVGPNLRDIRSLINPKKTDEMKKLYQPVAYPQVFGNAFVHPLSLIDLVFCEGPGANRIITASTGTN